MPSNVAKEDAITVKPAAGLKNAHWVVVAGSFLLTLVVWNYASTLAQNQAEAAFDRAADQMLELTTERMKNYEDGLWAGVGALYANQGDMSLTEWRIFVQTLQIDVKYPGINGIGVILNVPGPEVADFVAKQRQERPAFDIHPVHDRGVFLPITYIEKEATNIQAVGLDIAFEDNRFGGLMAARDTGHARITGPITLVQDEGSTPGFLFFAPFYRNGPQNLIDARRAGFQGAVYAPFVVKKLMRGVLDRSKRQIWVSISDGDKVIYDEHADGDIGYDDDPMFGRHAEIDMYGRTWEIDLRTNLAFRAANSRSQPTVILACGLTIDTLLLILFGSMARSNRRVFSFADQVTEQLRREKRDLITTNAALEQFSYVASHDLKTPIRSMRDATDYLIEDIEEIYPETIRDKRVFEQFVTLKYLINRMDALVKGVLECAQISRDDRNVPAYGSREGIVAIAEEMRLSSAQLTLVGDFPDLSISSTLFSQIFRNLLSNAVNHHHDPSMLQITVTGRVIGEDAEFGIADNGPGIDAKYHEQIFEMFQSLDPEKSPDSTGIGLAIVRKATDVFGGDVIVRSAVGRGTTFVVTLPRTVRASVSDIAAE